MGEEASRQLILLFPASQMTDNFFYKTLSSIFENVPRIVI
jgi:hypothetical protein